MRKKLKEKISEALSSVLPITVIVLLLSFTLAPMPIGTLLLFLLGAAMLIVGMGFFSLGADMAMMPIGEQMGRKLGGRWKLIAVAVICFLIGAMVTIAEPDLQVLARQVPAVPDAVIILAVAAGVGVFLVVSMLRTRFNLPLGPTLIALYTGVFLLSIFVPNAFLAVAFDSGGVTTGPITVPFIMALGIGMASMRNDKNSGSDSFGFVSLGSVGPIIAVMLLGIFYKPQGGNFSMAELGDIQTTRDAARVFLEALPAYAEEVLIAIVPIVVVFLIFQLITRRFQKHQLGKMAIGIVYAYVGLVMFLTGVNVGFMPSGQMIGSGLAGSAVPWILVLVGMVVGYFIVRAEPAVQILTRQVEDVSNGSVTQKAMMNALSIGVAISVGLAMLRILTGLPIMALMIPGYIVALGLTFLVPQLYTSIAFDSGGVASGPMTTTFLLPLATGACSAVGGNIMTDAFGIVAMVAMTPLITIQMMGYLGTRKERRLSAARSESTLSGIMYFDSDYEEEAAV